ncbi:pectin lyase, putative [Phytophthora infestans T30-4]|uniref:pectin lyase n=2 Tax=Phytophthora infestans TaxID=4787 RepID=D0P3W4_PHYIT|nr:pectin lyase, putative [Phytophthora infestans T30-4]EEY62062.1 pectin lyase, putative [Phytophthora infestans T30-4]KAF4030184.1 Pectate lyase [Phytophthora infestans]|eukprot:XP_002895010.1 pectin lyase, putative [Phytophthora infestans T30-4]
MARFQFALSAMLALAASSSNAFTIGSPSGLAAGTTGGAGGKTVYPASNNELVSYLASNDALVIVLNKTFDFRGTEGTTTETGCRPDYTRECMAKKNGYKSQDVIITGGSMANTGGCTGGTQIKLTYDNAARKRMTVTGNKTIRGIGKSGVIKGKGLMLDGDNIILQNIHITELNPHVVWGGDAIFMQGKQAKTALNKIWLDHIKISRIGRQMIVTNKAGAATMTISNSDFDGNTEYSATCDGHHYWTFLFYGKNTGVSMLNNYVHGTSGRSPKIGGNPNEKVVVHVANNYWGNSTGHSFELGVNGYVLAEGNYFENTKQPLYVGTDGSLYAASSSDECSKYLGRSCAANTLVGSGSFQSRNGGNALKTIKGVSTLVSYKPDITDTTSGSQQQQQQQQQSSQTGESAKEESFVTSGSDQQQVQQQQQWGGSLPYQKPSAGSKSRKLAVKTINLANEWKKTTGNFGVGKLD